MTPPPHFIVQLGFGPKGVNDLNYHDYFFYEIFFLEKVDNASFRYLSVIMSGTMIIFGFESSAISHQTSTSRTKRSTFILDQHFCDETRLETVLVLNILFFYSFSVEFYSFAFEMFYSFFYY